MEQKTKTPAPARHYLTIPKSWARLIETIAEPEGYTIQEWLRATIRKRLRELGMDAPLVSAAHASEPAPPAATAEDADDQVEGDDEESPDLEDRLDRALEQGDAEDAATANDTEHTTPLASEPAPF